MKVEIKPAPRSNPEGRDDLPWNIWKNGVNTNVKPNRRLAEEAADKLLHRTGEVKSPKGPVKPKHYMECPRPTGGPKKGAKVKFYIGDTEHIGVVADYLATQFIVEYGKGEHRVVAVNDDWSVA